MRFGKIIEFRKKLRHGLPITVGMAAMILGLKNIATFLFINDLHRNQELWNHVITTLNKSEWMSTYNFLNGVADFALIILGLILILGTQRIPKIDPK